MKEKLLKGPKEIPFGCTEIAKIDGINANMMMDFCILRLRQEEIFEEQENLECIYLLVYGKVEFSWDNNVVIAHREDNFNNSPWVLHVPAKTKIKIKTLSEDCEITIHRTFNNNDFDAKLYKPQNILDEVRGKGTMNEVGTRVVRTVLDYNIAPWSNFVFGEVITIPGKWSSYPPHIHPQPEIYYYKVFPNNGYGYCEYGDEVYKIHNNDTVFILPNYTHPQVAAPGYALWYMWVIRQTKDIYKSPDYPIFLEEHQWLLNPKAEIWEYKS